MSDYRVQKVKLESIDFDDSSYIFTFEPSNSLLAQSIKKAGVINPPVLELLPDKKYRIITGIRRLTALKNLNLVQVEAKVYSSKNSQPEFDFFLLNFYDNIGTRFFSTIEKANIIHKLLNQFQIKKEKIITEYLPLLELGKNPEVIQRYLAISEMDKNLQMSINEDFISIDSAIGIQKMAAKDRTALYDLFRLLRIGKNKQKEFVQLFADIKAITGKSTNDILLDSDFQIIMKDNSLTAPVKTNRIKILLKKIRYPNYSKIEEKFELIKKNLKLPPNALLRSSPFFESNKYSLELIFKSEQEFTNLISLLNSEENKLKIKDLENLV